MVEGALHASGGGPVADGSYNVKFTLFDKATGGTAAWSEGPVPVKTAQGRFSYALGTTKPLDAAKLAGLAKQWLQVDIGADTMARKPLHAVAFSLYAAKAGALTCSGCLGAGHIASGAVTGQKVGFAYAASDTKGGPALKAKALDCSGCVGVAHLKFDKDVDLGGKALKAGKLTSAGDIQAAGSVAAKQFLGDGSKLTGIKIPSGDCPKGQAVTGIDGAGKLKCAKVGGELDIVSGGSLTNHFVDAISGSKNKDIPDFNSNGLLDTITVPDIGTAETFEVSIEISKAPFVDVKPKDGKPDYDPSDLTILLFPPTTKALPAQRSNVVSNFLKKPEVDTTVYPNYVLHQGSGAGTLNLVATYPTKQKPVSGDLTKWIGKNPKGKWRLLILDNADRADAAGKDVTLDGKLVSWSIKLQTLSGSQVGVQGSQFVKGTLWGSYQGHDGADLGGDLKVGSGLQVAKNTVISGDLTVKGKINGGHISGGHISGWVFHNWGSKKCPANTEKLYDGVAFNGHYSHQGAGDPLCLVPGQAGPSSGTSDSDLLYPLSVDHMQGTGLTMQRLIYCARCYTPDKGPCFEMYGSETCPTGFNAVYRGFAIGGHFAHANPGKRFCLDREKYDTSTSHSSGSRYYHTRVHSGAPGPYGGKYPTGRTVRCAMCCRK